jgi:hypothetical protein
MHKKRNRASQHTVVTLLWICRHCYRQVVAWQDVCSTKIIITVASQGASLQGQIILCERSSFFMTLILEEGKSIEL